MKYRHSCVVQIWGIILFLYSFSVSAQQIQDYGENLLPGNEYWSDQFHIPGVQYRSDGGSVNGYARALAANGSQVYIGGYFPVAGGVVVNNIARWDGKQWHSLGSGTNAPLGFNPYGETPVQTIAVAQDGKVYIGGNFTKVDGKPISYLAVWDGMNWHNVGDSLDGTVRAIAVTSDGLIYAAGDFLIAGETWVNHIARWDGTKWAALGEGIDGYVLALAVSPEGRLFAGGHFEFIGETRVNHIAQWDGTTWSPLNEGVQECSDYCVRTLNFNDNALYAGGGFNRAGDKRAVRIAKWDGGKWNAFIDGVRFGVPRSVYSIAVDGNHVYAGLLEYHQSNPRFLRSDEIGLPYWDGEQWRDLDPVESGSQAAVNPRTVNNGIYSLVMTENDLVIGGYNGIGHGATARWNKAKKKWMALGGQKANGLDGPTYAIAADQLGNVYVSGYFFLAGSERVNRIAQWDGTRWHDLAGGLPGMAYTLAVDPDNQLYAGVYLDEAVMPTEPNNPAIVSKLYKWNSTSWSALPGGTNGMIHSIAFGNLGQIYVGGSFDYITDIEKTMFLRGLAGFDDGRWFEIGNSNVMNPGVVTSVLTTNGGEIYICWSDQLQYNPGVIARWNGTRWDTLGLTGRKYNDPFSGGWGTINRIAFGEVGPNDLGLFAVGNFSTINGTSANNIAYYNFEKWQSLGNGVDLDGSVYSYAKDIMVAGRNKYIVGFFNSAYEKDGTIIPANGIVKWDGNHFSSLGDGINISGGPVEGISAHKDQLYVFGSWFGTVGGKNSLYFAQYSTGDAIDHHEIWPPLHSIDISLQPRIDWEDDFAATGYNFRLGDFASDPSTTSVLFEAYSLPSSSIEIDQVLSENTSYWWQYQPMYSDHTGNWSKQLTFTTGTSTPVEKTDPQLLKFSLGQNYPNPFNPSTQIQFSLHAGGEVRLTVFDITGREIAILVNGRMGPGTYTHTWNAANSLASGIYFYRLQADNKVAVKKMTLVK